MQAKFMPRAPPNRVVENRGLPQCSPSSLFQRYVLSSASPDAGERMSAEELVRMSLAELIKAYAARHLSPVEVMETTLSHAQSVNSSINALFSFRAEQAIAGARLSEPRWKSNAPLPLLARVPLALNPNVTIPP